MRMTPEHVVRPAGLMRCCYPATLDKRIREGGPPEEGEVIDCLYCDEQMIYQGGAWQWLQPATGDPDLTGKYGVSSKGRVGFIEGRKKMPWGLSWVGTGLDGEEWASRNPTIVSKEGAHRLHSLPDTPTGDDRDE